MGTNMMGIQPTGCLKEVICVSPRLSHYLLRGMRVLCGVEDNMVFAFPNFEAKERKYYGPFNVSKTALMVDVSVYPSGQVKVK